MAISLTRTGLARGIGPRHNVAEWRLSDRRRAAVAARSHRRRWELRRALLLVRRRDRLAKASRRRRMESSCVLEPVRRPYWRGDEYGPTGPRSDLPCLRRALYPQVVQRVGLADLPDWRNA